MSLLWNSSEQRVHTARTRYLCTSSTPYIILPKVAAHAQLKINSCTRTHMYPRFFMQIASPRAAAGVNYENSIKTAFVRPRANAEASVRSFRRVAQAHAAVRKLRSPRPLPRIARARINYAALIMLYLSMSRKSPLARLSRGKAVKVKRL